MTTTIGVRRRAVSLITAAAFAASGAFVLANGTSATADEHNQWVYVCKYVGTPGEDERLQTGQNPILVSINAVEAPIVIGAPFNDAQGRSVVIGYGQPGGGQDGEPAPDCPPELPPPPTTTAPPTTTTPPPTTTTTAPPTTTTTTAPPTTTTTTPPTTTTTTAPPTTTTTTGTQPPTQKPPKTKPPVNPPAPTSPGGGGVTPGVGAPDTGGAGDSSPLNGLIGAGMLMTAAGILSAEAVRRRRETAKA
jgi:hypothetical protein